MGKKPSNLKRRNVAGSSSSSPTKTTNHKKERRSKTDNSNSDKNTNNTEAAEPEITMTTWQTVRSHPTFWAFIFLVLPFGIPFLFQKAVTIAKLQHPEKLNTVLDVLESKFGYHYYGDHNTASGDPVTSVRFRPAVKMNETRQVLILGSLSSGMSQTATDLNSHFEGLEIGHQDTDTTQSFVRDGTVSWFHGIRYLDLSDRTVEYRAKMIVDLCSVSWRIYSSDKVNFNNAWSNYGMSLLPLFGPTAVKFDVPHWYPSFRKSYLRTCHQTLLTEIGCGIDEAIAEDNDGNNNDNNEGNFDNDVDIPSSVTPSKRCPTPFERTLIQTRRPWDIVASLVTRYCGSSSSSSAPSSDQDGQKVVTYKSAPTTLVKLFQALYPDYNHTWFPERTDNDYPDSNTTVDDSNGNEDSPVDTDLQTCTNQMSLYVTLWYNDLLDSFDKIHQHDKTKKNRKSKSDLDSAYAVYPIESTPVCQVTKMAGFGANNEDDASVVYRPNSVLVSEFCNDHSDTLFGNTQRRFNTQNVTTIPDKQDGEDQNVATQSDHRHTESPYQLVPILLESTLRSAIDSGLGRRLDELHARMGYSKKDLHR